MMRTSAPFAFHRILLFISALSTAPVIHAAEEKLYVVPLSEIAFNEGQAGLAETLARPASNRWTRWSGRQSEGGLGVRVAESATAYLAHPQTDDDGLRFDPQGQLQLAIRTASAEPVHGFCDLSTASMGRQAFAFTFDPSKHTPATEDEFEAVRSTSYRALAEAQLPGASWFRHLANEGKTDEPEGDANARARRVERELSPTFAAFSGGRAMAENLALDRELIIGRVENGEEVALEGIEGITVPAIDWKPRLPSKPVEVDPLSLSLPLDQHALFFPSPAAFLELLSTLENEGAPVLQNYDVRSPFKALAARYLTQLGMSDRDAIGALPVTTMALTGGDPFLPSGSDIAVLFEAKGDAAALFEMLAARVEAAAGQGGAQAVTFAAEGVEHRGFQNADRSLSSHVLRRENLVALTNSTVQLKHLLAVATGDSPSLGAADEFAFFRHRYPIGGDESAFLFLSDEAIRRWCGPRLRIGASRRARAIAAMGELTARELAGRELTDDFAPLLGSVRKGEGGLLQSENFGSLRFTTPVSELAMDKVTATEKAAYLNWRRGYQSGWRRVFDPIALRLSSTENGHEIDLSVLPLTIDTQYREWIQLAGDAVLSPAGRHAHDETVLFLSFAIDSSSNAFLRTDKQLTDMLPGVKVNPLAWVGQSVSVYLERDFFWRALANSENEGSDFLTSNVGQLPIGIRVESKSNIKLALFLTALRGLSEASAPGLLRWDKRNHGKQAYIAVISEGGLGTDLTLFYATVPGALLLSLNEDILKRAIDRELKVKKLDGDALPAARHALMHALPEVFDGAGGVFSGQSLVDIQRSQSWRTLPVLNEWRRRAPGADPVAQHLATFGTPLSCPGGNGYRWNAEAMTMESVAFGHPTSPKGDAGTTGFAAHFGALTAGLGFEDDGLRVRASLAKRGEPIDDKPAPAGKVLATAKALYPTRVGSIRRYEFKSDGAPFDSVEFTIIEPGERDGQPTIRTTAKRWLDDETVDEDLTEHQLTNSGLGILSLSREDFDQHYTEPMIELPTQLVAGQTQMFPLSGSTQFEGEDEPLSIYGEVEITPVGHETVTVPAGTFDQCVRVEATTRMVNGGSISTSSYTNWYRAGIGLIKSESDAVGGQVFGLTEYETPED